MSASLHVLLRRLVLLCFLIVGASEATAQTYYPGDVVTNTTGSFSLAGDEFGLTTYVQVFTNGVRTGLVNVPISISGLPNAVYEYRYIWLFQPEINGVPSPAYEYHIGTVVVTVDQPVVPSAPGTLMISDVSLPELMLDGDGYLTISWGASSGHPTVYELYRSSDGGGLVHVYSGPSTAYADQVPSGTHVYQARACNAVGCSGFTNTQGVTVTRTPSVPGGITFDGFPHPGAGLDTDGSFSVHWGASTDHVMEYWLEERVNGGAFVRVELPFTYPPVMSASFSGKPDAVYEYRVRACNAFACSDFTPIRSVQVMRAPGAPAVISGPATDEDGTFTLSWSASYGTAETYILQRSTGGTWSTIQEGSATSRNETGLDELTYSYRVQACNLMGCSSWSPTKTVQVQRTSAAIAPFPALVGSNVPATLPLSMRVDVRGGLELSLGIETPAGVNGLGPSLSLAYNSLGAMYPQGGVYSNNRWSLAGLSSIQRCSELDTRLCLIGEGELVSENPALTAPPAGQRYRVKRRPNVLVIREQDAAGVTWYSAKRDGKTYRYGLSSLGRKLTAQGQPEGWYLQEVVDEFGNALQIDYESLSTGYRDKVPVLIRYGGYRVEFVYNRITSNAAARVGLHTIRSVTNGATVSEYRIIRGVIDSIGLPAIDAIQKCGFSAAGSNPVCTAPIRVDEVNPPSGARSVVVTDGLGVRSEAVLWPRAELASANAVFAASEVPFPLAGPGFPFNFGSEFDWVVTQLRSDNGIGGTNVSDFAYRSAGGNNDTMRQRLQDGSYLYTSYFPHLAYTSDYSDQVSKQARYTAIAGTSGARRIAFEENEWDLLVWDKHNGARPDDVARFPVLTAHRKHTLDQSGNIVGGEYTTIQHDWDPVSGTLSGTVAATVSGYDTSGVSISANVQRTTTSTTTFANDVATWIVGRIASSRTESTVPGRSGIRGFSTTYEPYSGYATYKVGTETSSADSGSGYVYKLTSTSIYDQRGNVSSVTLSGSDFAARTETYESYVDNRYPTYITKPTGTGYSLQSTLSYDRRFGTPSSVTDVNNLSTGTTRNNLGHVTEQTLPNGTRITMTREACSALCGSSRSFPRGAPRFKLTQTTTHPFEPSKGAPAKITYFDALGRPIRVETEGFSYGQWMAVDSLYNALGQLEYESLSYEISGTETPRYIAYAYDERGRQRAIDNPDGSRTTLTFEQLGDRYRITRTDTIVRPGGSQSRVRIEEYDSLGQLRRSVDANGTAEQVVTEYQYDQTGKADRVRVNGNDATYVYSQYDAFGRVVSIDDRSVGLVSFSYDGLGQLRYRMNAEGETTRFDYDLVGRIYQRTDDLDGPKQAVHAWTYDTKKVGYLSSRSSPGFNEEYWYDNWAQVQQVSAAVNLTNYNGTLSTTMGRDNYGRVTSQSWPSGLTTSIAYNPQGYGNELRDSRNNNLLGRIDAMNGSGAITQQSYGNGLTTTRNYDPLTGLVTGILTGNGAVQNHTYVWWSDGSLYQRGRPAISATETLTYDNLGRLDVGTTTTPSGTRTVDYGYDNLGNLRSKREGSHNVSSYSYANTGAPHRVQSAVINGGTHYFSYDANGNVTFTNGPGTSLDRRFSYDGAGMTTSVVQGDPANPGAREDFLYGPDGDRFYRGSLNRTSTTPTTDRTIYAFGGKFELILPGTGTITSIQRTYLGPAIHIRQSTATGSTERFEYIHTDHLGSIDAITDANRSVVSTSSFDPFGAGRTANWFGNASPPSIGAQQTRTNRGFTGHEHVYSTGLIHMNGRMYDPALGRFMSPDPFIQQPAFSQSYNRYAYAFNNPLSKTDPTGYMAGGAKECTGSGSASTDCPNLEGVTVTGQRIPEPEIGLGVRWATPGINRIGPPDPIVSAGVQQASAALCAAAGMNATCYSADLTPFGLPFHMIGNDEDALYEALEEYAEQEEHRWDIVKDLTIGWFIQEPEGDVMLAGKRLTALERTRRALALRAMKIGTKGEALVRRAVDLGAKTAIQINGRTRIPDGINRARRVLSEVKNVRYMHYSTQLRDYAQYAKANRMRFDLYLRPGTQISPQLKAAWDAGDINIITKYLR